MPFYLASGDTPLHSLMKNQDFSLDQKKALIELLVKKGANINARNKEENTALHLIVTSTNISYNDKENLIDFFMVNCNADNNIFNNLKIRMSTFADTKLISSICKIEEKVLNQQINISLSILHITPSIVCYQIGFFADIYIW